MDFPFYSLMDLAIETHNPSDNEKEFTLEDFEITISSMTIFKNDMQVDGALVCSL